LLKLTITATSECEGCGAAAIANTGNAIGLQYISGGRSGSDKKNTDRTALVLLIRMPILRAAMSGLVVQPVFILAPYILGESL